MGGLSYVLSVNPRVKIYAPTEPFGVFGSSLPSTFYRKDEALVPEKRYFNGSPTKVMKFGSAWPNANFELVDNSVELGHGISLISLVSDKPGTRELRELSLAIDTSQGLVLIVGCSHPGIDRIVDAATTIDKRIHLILGGMHLVNSPDAEIARLVSVLHDQYHVEWVAPGHCTGEPAFAALEKSFGSRYLYAGLGSVIELDAPRRADRDRRGHHIMGLQGLRDYHKIKRNILIGFGMHGQAVQR
jgi:7,8-dihydropterin-6-yl-methyl-4-(beta-D-ribofuranosyl)aminobenzene 5'-phosphate synthase